MKRTNFILNGFLDASIVLVFAQCSDKNQQRCNFFRCSGCRRCRFLKHEIAYVEIDSLLTKYNFWNDLNEVMIQKEENIRTTLNEKQRSWMLMLKNSNANWKIMASLHVNVLNKNR